MKNLFLIVTVTSLFIGCQSYRQQNNAPTIAEKELSVGIVQKEIYKGMNQADVAKSLGSPNIVTRDKNGVETWIYDKIASKVSYSQDTGALWLIVAGYQKSSGSYSSVEKTLTIIIKFDADQLVDSFSYHSSKF